MGLHLTMPKDRKVEMKEVATPNSVNSTGTGGTLPCSSAALHSVLQMLLQVELQVQTRPAIAVLPSEGLYGIMHPIWP